MCWSIHGGNTIEGWPSLGIDSTDPSIPPSHILHTDRDRDTYIDNMRKGSRS